MKLFKTIARKAGRRSCTPRLGGCLAIGIAAVLCDACLDQQRPAEQSLGEISNVLSAASADATKYAPDELASVRRELAEITMSYDRKGYGDVIAHAPSVLADAKNLVADAAANKKEVEKTLNREWSVFAASLPPRMSAVQARVEELARTPRAAKAVDLDAARSTLADAATGWQHAQTAFGDGRIEEAIANARDARSKTETAAAALGRR